MATDESGTAQRGGPRENATQVDGGTESVSGTKRAVSGAVLQSDAALEAEMGAVL